MITIISNQGNFHHHLPSCRFGPRNYSHELAQSKGKWTNRQEGLKLNANSTSVMSLHCWHKKMPEQMRKYWMKNWIPRWFQSLLTCLKLAHASIDFLEDLREVKANIFDAPQHDRLSLEIKKQQCPLCCEGHSHSVPSLTLTGRAWIG